MRFVSIVLCVGVLFATEAQAPPPPVAVVPARLADGSYTYVFTQDGATVLTSVVTVRGDAANVHVTERAERPGLTVTTETTLTTATLRETAYAGSSTKQGAIAATITPKTLTLTANAQTQTLDALPGTRGIVVSDGLASSLAILPMEVGSVLGAPLTNAAINVLKTAPIVFKPSAAPRPDGVPATDIGSDFFVSDTTFVFWYDPRTLLVHAVVGGGLDVRLTAQSAPVAKP